MLAWNKSSNHQNVRELHTIKQRNLQQVWPEFQGFLVRIYPTSFSHTYGIKNFIFILQMTSEDGKWLEVYGRLGLVP